jgi:hypothetical protein
MLHLLAALGRRTIWHHDAIPASEWVYRNMKRVWFPLYDVVLILAGIAAHNFGVPVIETIFPPFVADAGAITLSAAAAVCLVGISFPRLYILEVIGKSTIGSLLAGYATALLLVGLAGDPNRLYIAGVAAAAAIVAAIRLDILKNERRQRRALELLATIEKPAAR